MGPSPVTLLILTDLYQQGNNVWVFLKVKKKRRDKNHKTDGAREKKKTGITKLGVSDHRYADRKVLPTTWAASPPKEKAILESAHDRRKETKYQGRQESLSKSRPLIFNSK